MTHTDDFHSLISQLKAIQESKDYLNVTDTWDCSDSKINDIIRKWISNISLSNDEKGFIDFYSKFQLGCVEYYLFNSQSTPDNKDIIELFRRCLFRTKQLKTLEDAVEFIRDKQQSNTNQTEPEPDKMLLYLMRMLDARSLAYRLCFKNLNPAPIKLNNEITKCLTHFDAKNYLYDINSNNNTKKKLHLSFRHRFFVGCCTFAIALFDDNRGIFQHGDDEKTTKYICLLAKYVRIILTIKNFEKDESSIYCLRGVLALLTNCVPTNKWISIINRALANPGDQDAQLANPFNVNFFSLIIIRLLGSETLQNGTIQYDSNDITSLVDVALVFLNKWYDTADDLNDDNDNINDNDSLSSDEQNQVLCLLRSNMPSSGIPSVEKLNVSQIIIPYIDAKYDRIRLMAISTLSRIMNNKDFKDLQSKKPNMGQDIVKLIFYFIDQASKTESFQYKGISFALLLRYLLRFLVQDFIKEETKLYLPQIITFAEQRHLNALKILRRLSSSTKMIQQLTNHPKFDNFLNNTAITLFNNDPRMKKVTEDIRRNLATEQTNETSVSNDSSSRQAFISYSHTNKKQRIEFVDKLNENKIFEKIWIDETHIEDNLADSISSGIRQSQAVFVLLSKAYCESDTCRREWEFALNKKIKVYPVIVEEGFKRDNYDWVLFNMGQKLYYRLYETDAIKRLMQQLKSYFHEKQKGPKIQANNSNESKSARLKPKRNSNSDSDDDFERKPVIKWTSDDIQHWCRKKNLAKWCTFLAEYHGEALLELSRILETDANLPHITHGNDLNLMDAVLFKCELHKLLLRKKAPVKTLKKHDTMKSRSTNTSAK